jgi:hypothetical protein
MAREKGNRAGFGRDRLEVAAARYPVDTWTWVSRSPIANWPERDTPPERLGIGSGWVVGAGQRSTYGRSGFTADPIRRIVTMTAMVAVPIAETAQMRRLVEFASEVTRLAAERRDLDLRELIDELHADLIRFTDEEDQTMDECDLALLNQRIAHRQERLEGLTENVRILLALLDLLESSGAPPGTTLGEALVAGYVSVLEVVEATRAVPDPLAG